MTKIDMTDYGVNERLLSDAREYGKGFLTGRVVSQEKGLFRIVCENGEQPAQVSGKFRYEATGAADFPAVGDFVLVEKSEEQTHAVIHAVLPRKSVFLRKAAGTANEKQVVAANIDTVFICTSMNNDFNTGRLERYLSVAQNSGARPVIVLTKADLCENAEKYISRAFAVAAGTDIVVSSNAQDGLSQLLAYLKKGQTVALIGSSGVGKSTLINRLLGEERLQTNSLRNDDKGRHTTTRRELFLLKNGAMVIDTPGMRELGFAGSGDGVSKTFEDIEALAAKCRFKNCTHNGEPGCAVTQAVQNGSLQKKRLLSYRKLEAESRYAEDTDGYLTKKREKFKNISKINKASKRKDF